MIELLVVLLMLGLIAGLTVPAIEGILETRGVAIKKNEIEAQLALLPLRANQLGQSIKITTAKGLALDNHTDITVLKPILVNANGFCVGGMLRVARNERLHNYTVQAPYCKLLPVETN